MKRFAWTFQSLRSRSRFPESLTLGIQLEINLDWLRSSWVGGNPAQAICLVMVLMAFALSFATSVRLKMHTEVPHWVQSAIPPALSRVAYGHRQYMSLNFVHDQFNSQLRSGDTAHLNSIIRDILAKNPIAPDRSDRMLAGEDKGLVVLTEVAFRLFGYKAQGVFYLYYVILFVSAGLFALAYWRNPYALLLLAAFLLLHRMVLPMIKYDGQLVSVTALRCMPVLSMIACMHCLMYLFEARVGLGRLFLLAAQTALIVLVVHVRSTTMWELSVIVATCLAVAVLRKGPLLALSGATIPRFRTLSALIPLIAVVVFLAVLHAHRAYGFPEEYHRDGQTVSRPFWHNIFSGLAYNPNIARRYDPELRIDDHTVHLATKQYLQKKGREELWNRVGGNSRDYVGMRWQAYDQIVKEMLVDFCLKYFSECVAAFLYYKPVAMVRTVLWVGGVGRQPPNLELFESKFPAVGVVVRNQFMEATRQLDKNHERGRLWLVGVLTIIIAFSALWAARKKESEFRPVLMVAGLMAAGSTIPSIVGYPAPHTIAEAAISIPLLFALLAAYMWPRANR